MRTVGLAFTYRLEWSTETYEYYARCLEITGLYAVAPTAHEALARAETAVGAYLRESEEVFGGEPPKPLSERNFSGRFIVRTSPALHARLSMEATEQAVSLNQWVVQKLAGRQPSPDW